MTALRSEIDDMVRHPLTRDVAVACAELAARAIASGDLQAAVIAKEHEISAATHTGMHQHAVVCCPRSSSSGISSRYFLRSK